MERGNDNKTKKYKRNISKLQGYKCNGLTLTAIMKDNRLSANELFDATFSGTRYVSE